MQRIGMAEPGDYDLYLFALSWGPSFCCRKANQCLQQGLVGSNRLTVHGLWPSYSSPRNGKTFPSYCGDVQEDLLKISAVKGIERFEWKKHGSCSGLSIQGYFDETNRLKNLTEVRDLERLLQEHHGTIINTNLLPHADHVVISASPFCQLKEITFCLAKNSNDGSVGGLVPCPKYLKKGPRNSAYYGHKSSCSALVVDKASTQCQVVSKFLLQTLKQQQQQQQQQ